MSTQIEWTDKTWNPVTGCTRVSPGCDNCYAVRMTRRLAGMEKTKDKYSGLVNEGKSHFNGVVKTHPGELVRPLKWKGKQMVFVCSMSDLFHPEVPFRFIAAVFTVMAVKPEIQFQVLTKRPERMLEFFQWADRESRSYNVNESNDRRLEFMAHECWKASDGMIGWGNINREWPLSNVWLGVSVENQETANERIPPLLKCPAAVRFLSCEPLLGPVDLNNWFMYHDVYEDGSYDPDPSIRWVIVGGESGSNARPMYPYWVRSIRDQCADAVVPFFFKQWGAWLPTHIEHGEAMWEHGGPPSDWPWDINDDRRQALDIDTDSYKVGKKKAGRQLFGREHTAFPV